MNGPFEYLSDVEQGNRQRPWVYAAGLIVLLGLMTAAILVGDGKIAADSYSETWRMVATVLSWCLGITVAAFVFLCCVAFGGERYRRRNKPISDDQLTTILERTGTFGRKNE